MGKGVLVEFSAETFCVWHFTKSRNSSDCLNLNDILLMSRTSRFPLAFFPTMSTNRKRLLALRSLEKFLCFFSHQRWSRARRWVFTFFVERKERSGFGFNFHCESSPTLFRFRALIFRSFGAHVNRETGIIRFVGIIENLTNSFVRVPYK